MSEPSAAGAVRSAKVRVPVVTGKTQVFHGVAMDQFVRIREGDDSVSRLSRKRFVLGDSTGHDHLIDTVQR